MRSERVAVNAEVSPRSPHHARQEPHARPAHTEHGFTLVELLVAILIVGVLAAIAIPAFLSQDSKAYNSSAESLAQTAQTAAEVYASENDGSYKWGGNAKGLAALSAIEPSINTSNPEQARLTKAEEVSSGAGYKLVVVAPETEDEYTIERTSTGEIERKCKSTAKLKDCPGHTKSSDEW